MKLYKRFAAALLAGIMVHCPVYCLQQYPLPRTLRSRKR